MISSSRLSCGTDDQLERAIRPDSAASILAELRSATPASVADAKDTPEPDYRTDDYGYSA